MRLLSAPAPLVRPSLYAILALVALSVLAPLAHADCGDVAARMFGFSLGPVGAYRLAPGLHHTGSAHIVEGVGFDTLAGESNGIKFEEIMAFTDRGSLTGAVALGTMKAQRDAGFDEIVNRIGAMSGREKRMLKPGMVEFACEPGISLNVEATRDDDGERIVKISLANEPAQARTRQYIAAYCADPARRKPKDACK